MAAAEQPSRPLRFGVLCDGESLAAWQLSCVEALGRVVGVSAALLMVREPAPASERGGVLWRFYSQRVADRASASAAARPLSQALTRLPVMRLGPGEPGSSDLEKIRDLALDFVIDFSAGGLRAAIHGAARHGVWFFHFGEPAGPSSTPPGFWEIYRGAPVTFASLRRVTGDGGAEEVLQEGCFKTNPFSFVRNRDQLLREAAAWPARVCMNLDEGSTAAAGLDVVPTAGGRDPGQPSNVQFLWFLARLAGGLTAKVYQRLFRHQQWQVGVIDAPIHQLAGLTDEEPATPSVRWIPNPAGRFLADPFAVERGTADGGLLLVAEDYRWSTARGGISALAIGDSHAGEPTTLFDFPYHMSYPFLFRHEGRLFCVPETNEAREVGLYVLDEESLAWTKDCVLLPGRRLADSTLFEWDGRWWLLATDIEDEQVRNLHAWFAPDLRGPWQEHPQNPVKIDVRSSRPAGRPFIHDGSLYRPAQDCSLTYGGAVAINHVLCLTPTHYREKTVTVVRPRPEWPLRDGLHHLCGVGERTIIDACEARFEWRALVATLTGGLGKLRAGRGQLP